MSPLGRTRTVTLSNLVVLKEIILKTDSRLSFRRNIKPWLKGKEETKNCPSLKGPWMGLQALVFLLKKRELVLGEFQEARGDNVP